MDILEKERFKKEISKMENPDLGRYRGKVQKQIKTSSEMLGIITQEMDERYRSFLLMSRLYQIP